ncbi:hypothetical protein BDV93DRAFT_609729 [Ceratobasidium sp. AG-I]|nr:hypothetical protein BDV93DRAFT_609729 [Ceratobasidium sp. AG-I]
MLKLNSPTTGWADPSLLPVYGILAVSFYLVGKYVDQTYIRPPSKTGFGKGAPGFMTNVRKVAITPELAERMRRGEEVTPEEIAAAQAEAAKNPTVTIRRRDIVERDDRPTSDSDDREPDTRGSKKARKTADTSENEWIPEGHTRPAARRPQRRKK